MYLCSCALLFGYRLFKKMGEILQNGVSKIYRQLGIFVLKIYFYK